MAINKLEPLEAGFRILISEGDDSFRGALKRVFEKEGSQVTETATPEEALGVLEKSAYELVISDIEICTEGKRHLIREVKERGNCPVLLLTRGGREVRDQCDVLEAGRVECLVKPVKREVLLGCVYRLVGRRPND